MNKMALTAAVMGLLVLATVAWLGGCSPFRCAVRGLLGAVAVYAVVHVACKLVAGIIADAIVKARMLQDQEDKRPRL